jgi:molybdate transport system regulatory protein
MVMKAIASAAKMVVHPIDPFLMASDSERSTQYPAGYNVDPTSCHRPRTRRFFAANSSWSLPMITVRFRLDVSPACSIGPGKIALLQGIHESGSLRRAAHQLGMSYRRAWLLVDGLNRSFNSPVTMSSVGGKGGGGVKLTELGEDLVRRYGVLSRKFDNLARREFKTVATGAARQNDKPARIPRKPVSKSSKDQ